MIEGTQNLFLEALRASLQDEPVKWEQEIDTGEWLELFRMATAHHVLPMIFEAVYTCPAAEKADPRLFAQFKFQMIQQVTMQAMKTAEFLSLYRHLAEAGIRPLVVKGIICRNLYPHPDYRISSDEDLLISPEQFRACHDSMLAWGMQLSEPEQDVDAVYEVPYGKKGSPIYIELHKYLFPPDSDAYGDMNRFFEAVQKNPQEERMDGTVVWTMSPTDHLFYLICHSFKHFLHSGFGIRQVCDIILYANIWGKQVNWQKVLENCREIHADLFTAALFRIGERYLVFSPEKACLPECWRTISVDETMMLQDLLDSGVYGDSSMSRKHSSNMTLEAVAAQKQGKKAGNRSGVLKSVFPTAKQLEGRYPYLKKHPYLLPLAWGNRLLNYTRETGNGKKADNNAAQALKIGSERIELMKEYGILK